ncbi:MAG TPA: CobD/CbiB family cobalamin biosynthesis protein [Candidatus Dormibacteraeota bacterium]|nr:CobD/CbiB family cobalamin biosynthesis protein [Candidatus Dormibacteraeota bacterium]
MRVDAQPPTARRHGWPRPQRGLALLAAAGLDVAIGDRSLGGWHPVAIAGQMLAAGHERLRPAHPVAQLLGGAGTLAAVALLAGKAGAWLEALARGRTRVIALASALKPTFAVRQLIAEALAVASALEAQDLIGARRRLRALVSRPTADLAPPLVASAAIESLAENLADSAIGPWLAFALGGLPAAAIYRVVNTADAMYGYHGELEWLGKSAAHLDDLLNWLPSRAAALALLAAAALDLGPRAARQGLRTWRDDAARTESPNAGRPMAAMAGCLGRRLEKPGHYLLGERYPLPDASDLRRAARLTGLAAGLAVVTLAVGLEGAGPRAVIGASSRRRKR